MLNNDIVINDEKEMLAAVVAVLFTPEEIGENFIKYDKESIFQLIKTLESVFSLWYNADIEDLVKEAFDDTKTS